MTSVIEETAANRESSARSLTRSPSFFRDDRSRNRINYSSTSLASIAAATDIPNRWQIKSHPIRSHDCDHPETLAAKVLAQDVGDPDHAGVLLRGVLGTDEEARG